MVPRVHINLSAPGLNHLTLAQFGLKLLTVGGLAVTITFLWASTTLHQKFDALENQTDMILNQTRQIVSTANAKGMDLSNQAIQKIPQSISFVKHVRERVGFSWTQLLTDLESAVPRSLMMRTVSLDEKTNTVLLNGSAKSLQDLNRLIHQLEKHQAFHDVILTQHAKKKKKDTTKPSFITFTMKVSYDHTHRHSKTSKS
jgi:Tfp pilus assembly protein PilN